MAKSLKIGRGGSPESLKMHGFLCISHDFLGGVGSVGSPESLKMNGFPCISHNLLGEMGRGKARIIKNAKISKHF